MSNDYEQIPVKPGTKAEVTAQKRGGESFDKLLQKMVQQYDPEQARETEVTA